MTSSVEHLPRKHSDSIHGERPSATNTRLVSAPESAGKDLRKHPDSLLFPDYLPVTYKRRTRSRRQEICRWRFLVQTGLAL